MATKDCSCRIGRRVVNCHPVEKCDRGGDIKLKDKTEIHQVFEIPLAKYEVTEYRIYKGCCEACRASHTGQCQRE